MRFPRVAFLGLVPLACLGAACGSVTEVTSGASGTTSATTSSGTGGTGGASTTTTATTTTTTTGTGGAGGSGPDIGQPSDVYPAPHGPPPTVVSFGGQVLSTPTFVSVFFSNDDVDTKTKLKDFESKVGATQYWKANTAEYGVGPGTAAAPIELPETAPDAIDDPAIQTWLAGKLNSDDPAFGPVPAGAIYTLHYPMTTVISDGSGGPGGGAKSCQAFGGYHSSITLDAAHGSKNVAYAVIPHCPSFGDLSGLDAVTGPISHELIEAATDPYPMVAPAFAQMDDNHIYWIRFIGGGETGDMCAQFPNVFTTFPEMPEYVVQRSWSNKAAKAGHDPCVPAPEGSVYFNAAPVMKDNIKASVFGQMVNVKGIKIPVGETKVVDLQLFSDADTGGPWSVEVKDLAELIGGNPHLDISLDADAGQNGQTLHATITVNSAGKSNTETFIVISKLNGQTNIWLGIIGN